MMGWTNWDNPLYGPGSKFDFTKATGTARRLSKSPDAGYRFHRRLLKQSAVSKKTKIAMKENKKRDENGKKGKKVEEGGDISSRAGYLCGFF